MRLLKTALTTMLALSAPALMADGLVRDILSSGATTASTYLTFDKKLIVPARDDASSFVASGGAIRGPYLEAALAKVRNENPQLQASDFELASAILAAEQQ
jgi:uncharacterized protein (TIGR02448 family)